MLIKASAALRNEYTSISALAKETKEPMYIILQIRRRNIQSYFINGNTKTPGEKYVPLLINTSYNTWRVHVSAAFLSPSGST